jgi:anti-anti-sigma factor
MPESSLLIDLSGCGFIDSLGIAALVDGSRGLLEQGRSVAVAAASPQVRRILELTGVDSLLPISWSREEAIAELGGPDPDPS